MAPAASGRLGTTGQATPPATWKRGPMPLSARRAANAAAIAVLPASLLIAGATMATAAPAATGAAAGPPPAPRSPVGHPLPGRKVTRPFVGAGSPSRHSEPLTQPDNITVLG